METDNTETLMDDSRGWMLIVGENFKRGELNPYEFTVLAILVSNYDGSDNPEPEEFQISEIGMQCGGISVSAVRKALKSLLAKGHIHRRGNLFSAHGVETRIIEGVKL